MSDDDETLDEEYTNNMLDLVFVCDCTGSMGSYLDAAQSNINSVNRDSKNICVCTYTVCLLFLLNGYLRRLYLRLPQRGAATCALRLCATGTTLRRTRRTLCERASSQGQQPR